MCGDEEDSALLTEGPRPSQAYKAAANTLGGYFSLLASGGINLIFDVNLDLLHP